MVVGFFVCCPLLWVPGLGFVFDALDVETDILGIFAELVEAVAGPGAGGFVAIEVELFGIGFDGR